MTPSRDNDYLAGLVRELCKLPQETEWLEFKHNNADPRRSASTSRRSRTSAALNGKAFAYLIWGVENETHAILGTSFSPPQPRGRGTSRWKPGYSVCSHRRFTFASSS